jgi:hypothetical protein
VRTEGLGKFKNSPHRESNPHSALTTTLPSAPRVTPLSDKIGTNFDNMRRSLGRCNSSHGVCFAGICKVPVFCCCALTVRTLQMHVGSFTVVLTCYVAETVTALCELPRDRENTSRLCKHVRSSSIAIAVTGMRSAN